MSEFAEFVARLREAFGDATIDEAVARGKAAEPTFFARENGWTVGTKSGETYNPWQVDGSVVVRAPLLRGVRRFVHRANGGRSAVESPKRVRTCYA